jgi:hypothetical protein
MRYNRQIQSITGIRTEKKSEVPEEKFCPVAAVHNKFGIDYPRIEAGV